MNPELLTFAEDRELLCERLFRNFSVGVDVVSLDADWWRLLVPGELDTVSLRL